MASGRLAWGFRATLAALTFAAFTAGAAALLDGPVSAQTAPGSVVPFGDAASYGSPSANLNAPVVGMTATSDGHGYWSVAADGGVFSFGDAGFFGSEAGTALAVAVVGMAATPDSRGYWLVTDVGSTYNFGDAISYGSMAGGPLNAPVVGMAATSDGHGYWLVAADGGIFSFGDAAFYGSMGGTRLNQPVVGMAATPDGHGYWLVAADGGVFSFGDAAFYGSMGGTRLNQPVVGMAATPDGHGYWLVAADGGVFSLGDAAFYGSMGGTPPSNPVVGMAATQDGHGYWLTTTAKALPPPTPVPSVLYQCTDPAVGPAVEPLSIVLACGDGNASLTNLVWSSWTASTASATGNYIHNTCIPNCAEGTFVSVPASVELSYPIETGAGREFSTVTYSYPDPTAPGGEVIQTAVIETSAG